MTFYSFITIFAPIIFLLTGIILYFRIFKNKKRSAESIYKLINDLEKKYI